MREILFRGKTLDGDWIEGWYQPPAMGIGVTLAVFNDTSEHLTDIHIIIADYSEQRSLSYVLSYEDRRS